jgi:tRNA 2-selenouridine synthase
VVTPTCARAAYLVRAYGDLIADPARLDHVIGLLRPLHAAEVIAGWQAMALAGDHAALADDLMARHYDPRYARHRARAEVPVTVIDVDGLDDLPALAGQVAAAVNQ